MDRVYTVLKDLKSAGVTVGQLTVVTMRASRSPNEPQCVPRVPWSHQRLLLQQ